MINKIKWFLFFLFFPGMIWAVELNTMTVVNTTNAVRVVLSLSEPTRYQIFTLDNPNRLVMDLDKTRSHVRLKSLVIPGVKSVRSGHPSDSKLRLVFDLDAPLKYKYSFDANKNSVNLDLNFATRSVPDYILKESAEKTIPVKMPPRKKEIVIVIDPGHGGKDTGAVSERGINEKDVVLAIAKKLADRLNQQLGMRAVLTRNSDYFVPLRDRLKLARKGKADLFIAIHADAYFNNLAKGASVYALSRRGATSEAARWIAKRDNYSELGGVDLGELDDQNRLLRSVLIDLSQTATIADSLRLGKSILDSLEDVTRLHYSRVEQAPFVVLKSPDIPSVLVETGFISNGKEAQRLNDRQYQHKLAQALSLGVQTYLKKYPPGV